MSDPQIWTVIGLFAATLGVLVSSVLRTMRTEFASLRAEMNARFDAVNGKLEHLDRDVRFLMDREFRDRDS